MSFASMHNDYLDPDRHLWNHDEGPELEISEPKAGWDADCPYCGEVAAWDGTEKWVCPCGFEQHAVPEDYERGRQYADLLPRIKACEDVIYSTPKTEEACTPDEFFSCAPEGDFECDNSEAVDWHVYSCGEKDCPVGWHKIAYSYRMGRVNGFLYVETSSIDEDGNWECSNRWDEATGDNAETWSSFYRDEFSHEQYDYFQGWAKYWLDCAETGEDPLGQRIGPRPDHWSEFCVQSAEDLIKVMNKK